MQKRKLEKRDSLPQTAGEYLPESKIDSRKPYSSPKMTVQGKLEKLTGGSGTPAPANCIIP